MQIAERRVLSCAFIRVRPRAGGTRASSEKSQRRRKPRNVRTRIWNATVDITRRRQRVGLSSTTRRACQNRHNLSRMHEFMSTNTTRLDSTQFSSTRKICARQRKSSKRAVVTHAVGIKYRSTIDTNLY